MIKILFNAQNQKLYVIEKKKIKILGGCTTTMKDGAIVDYYENFLSESQSNSLFDEILNNLEFEHPTFKLKNGKTANIARLQSWMASENIREKKKISLFQKQDPQPWSETVLKIKNDIETIYGIEFDYVLINYYRNGKDMIAFHSDIEHQKKGCELVAGISLGVTRKFIFRNIKDESLKVEYKASAGSLIVMRGECQNTWKHSVPKEKEIIDPRISLTFRIAQEKD